MRKGTGPTDDSDPKKGPDKSFRTLIRNAVWAYKIMFSLSKRDTILLFLSAIVVALMPILSSYLAARVV